MTYENINGIECLLELGKYNRNTLNNLIEDVFYKYKYPHHRVNFWIEKFVGTPFEFESNLPILPNGVLRVRLSSFDCVTLIYTVIALANSAYFEEFVKNLYNLRYKDTLKGYINNCPDTGNILDFIYESILINGKEKGYIKDITSDIAGNSKLIEVKVLLERFKRPPLHDNAETFVSPKINPYAKDIFISKETIDMIDISLLQDGDIILMTKGPYNDKGEKIPVLITHLGIVKIENNQVYFYHATKHFSLKKDISENNYTGIYYDDEHKKEQIGVGIAGTFAGIEHNTYYNDILFFGFHQGIKRSLKDYLEINAIGVKFVRVTSPPIKCM